MFRRRAARLTAALAGAILLLLLGWRLFGLARAPGGEGPPLVIPVAGYAPGTVRLDQGLWVARQPGGEFYVFLDRDPHRGQPLNWVARQGLFMQAASYRMDGSCVTGPCDASPGRGLYRVESRLEGQHLVVYPHRIISGGFDPEPAWLTELKQIFGRGRATPSAPAQGP